MSFIQILGAVLKIISILLQKFFEKDAERRKKLDEAHETIKTGIKERDPAKVTSGFDSITRT